ncbi:MAG: PilZ domain-containing protein [Candidatus Sumerlaeia bacterium]|nr:PilZ domain-containing protein [Candidatus Sumerlaeia bacterium]
MVPDQPPDNIEKRRYERFLKEVHVSYTVLSKVENTPFEFGNSVTLNISRTGLLLLLPEPMPVPVLLQLQLRLPNRPFGLFVLGKTVYCSRMEEINMYRVGIKFVGILPPELESVLEDVKDSKGV